MGGPATDPLPSEAVECVRRVVEANLREALENAPDIDVSLHGSDESGTTWLETNRPTRFEPLVEHLVAWVLDGYGETRGLAALPHLRRVPENDEDTARAPREPLDHAAAVLDERDDSESHRTAQVLRDALDGAR